MLRLFIADQNYYTVPEWEPNAKMSGWSKLLEGGAVPIWQPLRGRRSKQGDGGKLAKWVNRCPVWKICNAPEDLLSVKIWAAHAADHHRQQQTRHSRGTTGGQRLTGSDFGLRGKTGVCFCKEETNQLASIPSHWDSIVTHTNQDAWKLLKAKSKI